MLTRDIKLEKPNGTDGGNIKNKKKVNYLNMKHEFYVIPDIKDMIRFIILGRIYMIKMNILLRIMFSFSNNIYYDN